MRSGGASDHADSRVEAYLMTDVVDENSRLCTAHRDDRIDNRPYRHLRYGIDSTRDVVSDLASEPGAAVANFDATAASARRLDDSSTRSCWVRRGRVVIDEE
jgi:hypothetical protein